MEIRFPMWIRVVDRPTANVFAILSGAEAFSRALIAGVMPLEAYRLFETARAVSIAYAMVGVAALIISLFIPVLIRHVGRRWVFTLGCLCMVAAPALMLIAEVVPFAFGLQCRSLAVVCVNITLNLYILDHIAKRDLLVAEPRRLAALGVAWSIGPGLGIWLLNTYGPAAVYLPSTLAATGTLIFFWVLRLGDNPAVQKMKRAPTGALQNIRRYWAQPRLRLAWAIAFSRSTHWTTFFVYPSMAIVAAGGDQMLAAAMLMAGQGLLFAAPIAGKIGARVGIRRAVIGGFVVAGGFALAAGLLPGRPWLTALLFFGAAFGSVTLDALGNIPFLRAVHPYERAEMASVFRTYIEVSQLLPPAIYAMVLTFFSIEAVFIMLGLQHLATAWLARYLPRSL